MTEKKILRMQIKIEASPERVFEALTSTDALKTWFAEQADISLADNRYQFWGKFTPGNPDREGGNQQLVAFEAGKHLQYKWAYLDVETTVTFKLRKRGTDSTILTLHQNKVNVGKHHYAYFTAEDFWFLCLENLRRYIDGKTAKARVDFSQSLTGNIHHETEIDASADTVFDVLINPKQLDRWIATKADVEPKQGGKFDLGWAGVPAFRILEITHGVSLSYEWPEDDGGGELVASVVTWTLKESNGKTRLTFVHSGFADDAETDGIQAGWRNFVNWVQSIAEYGDTWEPPLVKLEADAIAYSASIIDGQDDL